MGNRTLVVRLGPVGVSALYSSMVVSAHLCLEASVWLLIPSVPALWGLISLPFSLAALGWLLTDTHHPQRLKPALALTVAATLLHGLGMAWGFAQIARLH